MPAMPGSPHFDTLGPPDKVDNLPPKTPPTAQRRWDLPRINTRSSSRGGIDTPRTAVSQMREGDKGPAGPFSIRAEPPQRSPPKQWATWQSRNHNLKAVNSADELQQAMKEAREAKRTLVVNYGASWCHACSKMFPTFLNLSNEYSRPIFVYADVDKCNASTDDIKFTPTFRFYREGEKVDEFYGAGQQRLRDRIWLQS